MMPLSYALECNLADRLADLPRMQLRTQDTTGTSLVPEMEPCNAPDEDHALIRSPHSTLLRSQP